MNLIVYYPVSKYNKKLKGQNDLLLDPQASYHDFLYNYSH